MRKLAAALAASALAAVAGCDGRHATAPTQLQLGRRIYDRSCAACHTLSGHEHGAAGGDLAVADLTVDDIASFARIMPLTRPLTPTDVTAVARYIFATARRRN